MKLIVKYHFNNTKDSVYFGGRSCFLLIGGNIIKKNIIYENNYEYLGIEPWISKFKHYSASVCVDTYWLSWISEL